jgi:hypothetical protein
MKGFLLLLATLLLTLPAVAQNSEDWFSNWLSRVSETQSEQPHWVTPLVTVTPRLEQEIRYDVADQPRTNNNEILNVGNSKGLEFIPTHNTEIIVAPPPYQFNSKNGVRDGWGDMSFLLKYRLLSRNEERGNYIVTAFLGGSIPTGSYSNGQLAAIVTPTLAGGKGFGRFDIQSTIGGTLPVTNQSAIGHTIVNNNTLQYHVQRFIWPEVEFNITSYRGGDHDGHTQVFATPGVIIGRIPLHKRIGLTFGVGEQIAVSSFYLYNHSWIGSMRMPF